MTKNRDINNILILGFLFLVAVFPVNPIREFPLNDDWSYYRTVLHLINTGEFRYTHWAGVPMIPHLIWGMAFARIFGFSFSILRISNLVMGLLGITVTYKLFSDLFKDKGMALLFSLFILFNPIYFSLSFTFMTDITFYTLSLLSILFYIRYFRGGKNADHASGTLFSVLATLARQIGLFVPVAMFFLDVIRSYRSDRKRIAISFLHLLFPVAVLFFFNRWLKMTGNLPVAYRTLDEISSLSGAIADSGWRAFTYTGNWLNEAGILLFPFILAFLIRSRGLVKRHWKAGLILMVFLAFPIIRMNAVFPNGNLLYDTGIGPRTLPDIYLTGTNHQVHSWLWISILLKGMALTGGLMMILLVAVNLKESANRFRKKADQESLVRIFSALIVVIYNAVLLISFCYFDRYILGILVPLMILIFPFRDESFRVLPLKRYVVIPFLVAMSAFSILGTRDYLTWNSARWDLADKLMEEGIPAREIDGGFEFNGWHGTHFDIYGRWQEKDFDYLVTFGELDGMDTLMTRSYQNLLPLETRKIYVLRNSNGSERQSGPDGIADPG